MGAARGTRTHEGVARTVLPGRPRAFRRVRLRQRFVPLLVGVALVCTLGMAALAYIGNRADATTAAKARAQRDVQVAQQVLAARGANVRVQSGKLTVGAGASALVLNNDSSIVDRASALTGEHATIYQAEGTSLASIATNMPMSDGQGHVVADSRALGEALTGPPLDALLGQCGTHDTPSCHQPYVGVVTLQGMSYVAAFTPLLDKNGNFVGALGVGTPLDVVVAPALQLAVILLLAGLLVALIAAAIGLRVFGSLSNQLLRSLDTQLNDTANAAGALEHVAQQQVARSGRQGRLAHSISEQARSLDTLADVVERGRDTLGQSAGEIWAEMSQPGAAPDAMALMHQARQAAVVATRVGEAAEEVRAQCRRLVRMMNQVIAESEGVEAGGREVMACTRDLRAAVERVEVTLGERLIQRRSEMASLPLLGSAVRDTGRGPAQPSAAGAAGMRPRPGAGAAGEAWPGRSTTGSLPMMDRRAGIPPTQTGRLPHAGRELDGTGVRYRVQTGPLGGVGRPPENPPAPGASRQWATGDWPVPRNFPSGGSPAQSSNARWTSRHSRADDTRNDTPEAPGNADWMNDQE